MDNRDWQTIMRRCDRWLGAQRPVDAAEALRAAAEALDPADQADHYGEGGVVETVEQRIAAHLGTEAAVLMPSGTMAQQIALRIHCEQRGADTVAFHPTCHLELHEHSGYAHLHGLRSELLGEPQRLITREDVAALAAPVGAVLFELPQREIGGRLPDWEELVAQVEEARSRGAAVHLDGARLWESCPFLEHSPQEIAALFDSVYVSLYKGLGGLGGAVLAGSAELVAAARIWRRRHGGTLPRLFVLGTGALGGLDDVVARMTRYLAHARELTAVLGQLAEVDVIPAPPQTPLFHLHLRIEPEVLWERVLELALTRSVWLMNRPRPGLIPGTAMVEYTIGPPALEFSAAEVVGFFGEVLRGA